MPTDKTHAIVIFEDGWADEMDFEGFKVMNLKELRSWNKKINNLSFPKEVYFGTNESIEYGNINNFRFCFTIKEITESEAEMIKSTFGCSSFGQFPSI